MSTLEILKAARGLIESPENWWGRDACRPSGDASGPPHISSPSAHCALTALGIGKTETHGAYLALRQAMGCLPGEGIVYFNDSHTHAEVLAAFDEAIANVEAEAASA